MKSKTNCFAIFGVHGKMSITQEVLIGTERVNTKLNIHIPFSSPAPLWALPNEVDIHGAPQFSVSGHFFFFFMKMMTYETIFCRETGVTQE